MSQAYPYSVGGIFYHPDGDRRNHSATAMHEKSHERMFSTGQLPGIRRPDKNVRRFGQGRVHECNDCETELEVVGLTPIELMEASDAERGGMSAGLSE